MSRSLAVPNFHGGCVYADAILRYLRDQGSEIHYLWLTDLLSSERPFLRKPELGAHISAFLIPQSIRWGGWMCSVNPLAWLKLPAYLLRKLLARLGVRPAATTSPSSLAGFSTATGKEIAFLGSLIRRDAPTVVLIDGTELANLLQGIPPAHLPNILKLIVTHNVIHQRVKAYQGRAVPVDFMALTREEESRLLALGDVLIAIQPAEAATFRSMLPDKQVVVTPMPAVRQQLPVARQVPGRCLFVGGATQHNIDGLRWFLENVWPLVLRQAPEASLSVCGGVGEAFKTSYSRCQFHGGVPDLGVHYEEATVAIVPLQTGTGLKIKLVEAMRYGRAVVTTRIGAEGFEDLESGAVVPITDSAPDFAERVVALLANRALRKQCVEAQDQWICRNLSPEQAFGPLWEAIHGPVESAERLASV